MTQDFLKAFLEKDGYGYGELKNPLGLGVGLHSPPVTYEGNLSTPDDSLPALNKEALERRMPGERETWEIRSR